MREDVKTNAVLPWALELLLVFVAVVEMIGLQSSRLMKAGGGVFVFSARGTVLYCKWSEVNRSRAGHGKIQIVETDPSEASGCP